MEEGFEGYYGYGDSHTAWHAPKPRGRAASKQRASLRPRVVPPPAPLSQRVRESLASGTVAAGEHAMSLERFVSCHSTPGIFLRNTPMPMPMPMPNPMYTCYIRPTCVRGRTPPYR